MSVPFWSPGTFYNPGATVRPVTVPPIATPAIPNATFNDGNVQWTTEAGWSIVTQQGGEPPFQGSHYAMFSGVGGPVEGRIISQTSFPVRVGQRIKLSCQVRRKRTSFTGGRVELDWLDENDALIFSSQGNTIETTGTTTGNWRKSEVEAFAPAGAAKVRVAGYGYRTQGNHDLFLDSFTWDYSYTPEGSGLVFTAVQPNAGFSAATEPAWPTVNGQTVIDNEVVWEAIEGTRVVWEATPILVSGDTEPDFPNQVGANVSDGTIIWTAISRRVEDEKCPHTKYVAIASSKIFAGDDDIIAFSATVNPLDWTTAEDAGYLPFGLQNYGANPVRNLGLYRANLVGFNSQGAQIWQVDEDPANMALLDAVPIASIYYKTAMPVMNDLIFLNPVGVRNLGISAAATNLQAGGVGEPIDALVLAEIRAGLHTPHAIFVPAYGQYWLVFGGQVFVLTITGTKKMRWSRYLYPEEITDMTLLGQDLFLRTAEHKVWKVDPSLVDDDHNCPDVEVDLPFMPEEMSAGTLVIDVNYVRDRTSSAGGTFTPNSYGGNPATFDPPAYIVVAQYMTPGAGNLECVINGLDENGDPVSETITFDGDTEQRWITGTQLFSQVDDIDQTGNTADQFFSVGYQRYVADEEAEGLTVTFHGAIVVNNSSANVAWDGSTSQHGALNDDGATGYILPADSYLVVRQNANDTPVDFTYTPDGNAAAAVTLPAGPINRVFVGTVLVEQLAAVARTGPGFITPLVDLGIQFVVPAGCQGEPFQGVIQWNYLDLGNLGTEKEMVGFDLVATAPEGLSVDFGFDQRDRSLRTTPYLMEADTLPGQMVPFPISGPSFDMRITFEPDQAWEWSSTVLYTQDDPVGV